MPKVNLPEILDLEAWWRTQIDRPLKDSEWYQRAYRRSGKLLHRDCGTVFCLAGRHCEARGYGWLGGAVIALQAEIDQHRADRLLDGFWVTDPWTRAALDLGLTGDEASSLFEPGLRVDQIEVAFVKIKARAASGEDAEANQQVDAGA
jgi:hypothetical protein